jgi:hypothetical protein
MGFIFLPFILSEYDPKGKAAGHKKAPGRAAPQGLQTTNRVLKNKQQAVSQGVRRFEKRSLFSDR